MRLCLLVISLPVILASLTEHAQLSSTGTLLKSLPPEKATVGKKKLSKRKHTNEQASANKKKPKTPKAGPGAKMLPKAVDTRACSKGSGTTPLLVDLLPSDLVKLVIEYFNDSHCPVVLYAKDWLFKCMPEVAIDSVKMYVTGEPVGICGIKPAGAGIARHEEESLGFGDSQWFSCRHSQEGDHGSPICSPRLLIERTKYSTKWSSDQGFMRVAFDEEGMVYGILSKDGQTMLTGYRGELKPAARVYRSKIQAGRRKTSLLNQFPGRAEAVSGKGNRVVVRTEAYFEVHDVDTGQLLCRTDKPDAWLSSVALNDDGTEATFAFTPDKGLSELQIVAVNSDSISKPTTVKGPSVKGIDRLLYDDRNRLHVIHGSKVSLYNPSTNELALFLEISPLEKHTFDHLAASPNADYIVALYKTGKDAGSGFNYKTVVLQKYTASDEERLFGYRRLVDLHGRM